MKSIAQLDGQLPRVVPVEAAEGLAVVEFHVQVGHIQGIHGCGKAFPEILAQREIKRGVARQVTFRIRLADKGIAEPGAVVDIYGSKRPPGKRRRPDRPRQRPGPFQ